MNEYDEEWSEAELKFLELRKEFEKKIDAKLEQASALIKEAVALSEESGIPFHSYPSLLPNRYVPKTFSTKFPDLSEEFLEYEIGYYRGSGWYHSTVC